MKRYFLLATMLVMSFAAVFAQGYSTLAYYIVTDTVNENHKLFKSFGQKHFMAKVLRAAKQGKITMYDARAADAGHEFTQGQLSYNDVLERMNNNFKKGVREVKEYLILEQRAYDNSGKLIHRSIVAISPVRWYYREDDFERQSPLRKKLAWIYFPDVEKISKHYYKVFSAMDYKIDYYYTPAVLDFTYSNYFYDGCYKRDEPYSLTIECLSERGVPNEFGFYAFQNPKYNVLKFDDKYVSRSNKLPAGKNEVVTNTYTVNFNPENDTVLFPAVFVPYDDDTLFNVASLANHIVYHIVNEDIKAYSLSGNAPLTQKEVNAMLGERFDTVAVDNLEGGIDTLDIYVPYDLGLITKFVFETSDAGDGERLRSIVAATNEKELFRVYFSELAPYLKNVMVWKYEPKQAVSYYDYLSTLKFKEIIR